MGIIGEKPSGVWPKDAEARTAAACEELRRVLVAGKQEATPAPEVAGVLDKVSGAAQKAIGPDKPEDGK